MALGDAEIAFIISSGIMLLLFIFVYYKLYKKSDVNRGHKIIYVIIFSGLVVIGYICIFIFQLIVDWIEVLMFNIAWIPFFFLMLQDLAGNPEVRRIPFGLAILAAGSAALVIIGGVLTLIELLWFISMGEWAYPFPIFIALILTMGPLLILAMRIFRKGGEQYTDGKVTSGGRIIAFVLGVTFGTVLTAAGLAPFIFGESYYIISRHVGVVLLSIGIILFLYSLFRLIQERRKLL